MIQSAAEVRALSCPTRVIFEDALAADLPECVALEVEGLIIGGDAGIANEYK